MPRDQRQEQLIGFYSEEVADRAGRPLADDRERCLVEFIAHCREAQLGSVLEVGAGAGRDGVRLKRAGLDYSGIDLTPASAAHCRSLGLNVVAASAEDLHLPDDSFDTCWTMSTLMHLPGAAFDQALDEIGRVTRPGGVVEVGVWGHARDRDWADEHGRYFRLRSEGTLRASLGRIGEVVGFATWSHLEDGGRYQCARVIAA